ncbi:MAG: hypothetical protein WAM13_15270 [Candidatus Sulfotelmatobacter sp.]
MRTAAVFLGAIIVSLVTDAILRHFLTPDFGQIVVRMSTTPPNSQQWDEIWRQWHHVNVISVFVLAPAAAFASGVFVGLLQKKYAVLVAASTQIPESLFQLWSVRAKPWVHSPSGAAFAIGQELLPLAAAMLAVVLCRLASGRHPDTSGKSAPILSGP